VKILLQWAAAWRRGDKLRARSGLNTADTACEMVNVGDGSDCGYEPSPDANNTLIPAYNSTNVETVSRMY
jgi:hypothetical protein